MTEYDFDVVEVGDYIRVDFERGPVEGEVIEHTRSEESDGKCVVRMEVDNFEGPFELLQRFIYTDEGLDEINATIELLDWEEAGA